VVAAGHVDAKAVSAMKQTDPPSGPAATPRVLLHASPRTAEPDFAWPPSDEDLAGCGVILIGGDCRGDTDVSVVLHVADVGAAPAVPAATATHPARFRHWGVEHPEASYPFHVSGSPAASDISSAGDTWRAVFALAAGVSLAVLSYALFRGGRGELPPPKAIAARAPVAASPAPVGGLSVASLPARAAAIARRRADERVVPVALRHDAPALQARAAPAVIDAIGPRVEPAAIIDTAPAAPEVTDARSHAAAANGSPVAAAYTDPVPGDEDHIRAALTRWRTAYSELDANAAREVWPSVDARALERAFQALKSQEVRFDRCDLTVAGGSAQAACTGRAIYVPRLGKQSPRADPHEWTFELKKNDQRWTIASARSS
jgi:hypothetical protein